MYCKWGDFTGVVGAAVTMTPGFDPDVFTVAVQGQAVVDVDATLTIGDGNTAADGTVLKFEDCRALDGTQTWNPTSRTFTFQALDFRWQWRWAEPLDDGEFNRIDDSGKRVGTEKTAFELLQMCFNNLRTPAGIKIATTLSARLKTVYPYVNWQNVNPADEADKILQRYGGLLCPTPSGGKHNGTTYMWEANVGRDKPNLNPIETQLSGAPTTKPERIRVQGGENLYQLEVTLTAVGYDPDDTEWKTLAATNANAISYKPDPTVTNGWHFGFEEGLIDDEDKRAARQTVFRAYRLPDTLNIGGTVYNREDAMRRWENTLAEIELVDGEERYRAPFVVGVHYLAGAEGDQASINLDPDTAVPVEFTIDRRRGIIIFKEPVYNIDAGNRPVGADLTLHCAFRGDRYVKDFVVKNGIAGLYDVVNSESIYIRTVDGTPVNKAEADDLARDEAQGREAIYISPAVDQSTYTYPGVADIAPDGILRQITWNIDQGPGPTTTASWHREHLTSMPPLEARQRELELARWVKTMRDEERNDGRSNTIQA